VKPPYEVLIEHWDAFISARSQHGTIKAAHDALKVDGNPIGSLQLNSIKSLIPAIAAMDSARMKVIDDLNEQLAMANEMLRATLEGYETALQHHNIALTTDAQHIANQHVGAFQLDAEHTTTRPMLCTGTTDQQPEGVPMEAQYVTKSEVAAMIKRACAGRPIPREVSNEKPRVIEKRTRDESVPDHFEGWRVTFIRNSYRLSRRIGGKVPCIYIGTQWNGEKAALKLEQWRMKQASEGGNDDQ
jgi:hypothetical protein